MEGRTIYIPEQNSCIIYTYLKDCIDNLDWHLDMYVPSMYTEFLNIYSRYCYFLHLLYGFTEVF